MLLNSKARRLRPGRIFLQTFNSLAITDHHGRPCAQELLNFGAKNISVNGETPEYLVIKLLPACSPEYNCPTCLRFVEGSFAMP